ncbi:hypothetical protein GCM10023162_20350 [Klenkia terrae]
MSFPYLTWRGSISHPRGTPCVLLASASTAAPRPTSAPHCSAWPSPSSRSASFQLRFTGSAIGLFGNWLKWLFLSFITLGVYLLWVIPRIQRWKWQHTEFDQAAPPLPLVSVHAAGALPPRGDGGWAAQPLPAVGR